jgi:ABC-type multidrug transport system fused ATPase/permease subunit
VANPKILILDEATSSIDPRTEARLQEALERLIKGRTTIVIAHRLQTIVRADHIIVIEDGRVVEEGRHDELLAKGGAYARLYGIQMAAELQKAESARSS